MITHPVLLDDDALMAECEVARLRRGGPGGQHRNKVETAVRLCHEPTGVTAEANETRSQERNKHEAISRLRMLLALACRSDERPNPDLQAAWNSLRQGTRMPASANAKAGPSLVAHVFDSLDEFSFDLGQTADSLQVTSSQLVKFLRSNAQVWQTVNSARQKLGLPALR